MRILLAVIVALLTVPVVGHAATPVWITNGPFGGSGTALARSPSDPNVVYLGTSAAGVFRSADGGASWASISDGLEEVAIQDVFAFAGPPETVVAVSQYGNVYRRTAEQWSKISTVSFGYGGVEEVVGHPGWLVAIAGGCHDGFLLSRSRDRGATWTVVTGHAATAAMCPPKEPFSSDFAMDVVASPLNETTVWIAEATSGSDGQGRVWRTDNGGVTWSLNNDPSAPANDVRHIALPPPGTHVVAQGYFGTMWSQPVAGPATWSVGSGPCAAISPPVLLVGANQPFSCTGDITELGLIAYPRAVSANPTDPLDALVAVPWRAVQRRTATGFVQTVDGVSALAVNDLQRGADGALLAGTEDGVRRSLDNGASWQSWSDGLPMITGGGATMIVGLTNGSAGQTVAVGGSSLYSRAPGDAAWTTIGHPPAYGFLLADAPAGSGLIVGSHDGIWRSTDNGVTWQPIGLNNRSITQLAVAPSAPTTLYAGSIGVDWKTSAFQRSDDGGLTWTANLVPTLADGSLMPIVAGAVDPHNPRHVAIGSSRGALRISHDGGATWRAATAAGRGSQVVTISFDPDNPTVIYAGTLTDGLSASIDDGASFGHIGPLLRGQAVQALMWDPAPVPAAGVRAARAAAGQRGFLAALSGRVGGVGRTSFRPSRPLLTKPGSTQARTGQKPTCDAGNWQAADTITTQITIAGQPIKDTTTVPARMVSAAISCAVKARNAFATVRLALTGAVIGKPYATRKPRISGRARSGTTLRCLPGRWTAARGRRTTIWWRGERVIGHGARLHLTTRDLGAVVRCGQRAKNQFGARISQSRGARVRS